jgi:hypothetical protein
VVVDDKKEKMRKRKAGDDGVEIRVDTQRESSISFSKEFIITTSLVADVERSEKRKKTRTRQ